MYRQKEDDLLWLFDQVAFEHGFKLPDRNTMLATRDYWHEPSGDADGTVTVCMEDGKWIAFDAGHLIVTTDELRKAFVAAEQYIDEQGSAVAL